MRAQIISSLRGISARQLNSSIKLFPQRSDIGFIAGKILAGDEDIKIALVGLHNAKVFHLRSMEGNNTMYGIHNEKPFISQAPDKVAGSQRQDVCMRFEDSHEGIVRHARKPYELPHMLTLSGNLARKRIEGIGGVIDKVFYQSIFSRKAILHKAIHNVRHIGLI